MKQLFYSFCLFALLSIIGGIIVHSLAEKPLDPTLVSGGYNLQDIMHK